MKKSILIGLMGFLLMIFMPTSFMQHTKNINYETAIDNYNKLLVFQEDSIKKLNKEIVKLSFIVSYQDSLLSKK